MIPADSLQISLQTSYSPRENSSNIQNPVNKKIYNVSNSRFLKTQYASHAGDTNLHSACRIGAAKQVTQQISVSNPSQLILAKNKYGETPLHVMNHETNVKEAGQIAIQLITAEPDVLEVQDSIGLTPLHSLFRNKATQAVMDVLAHVKDENTLQESTTCCLEHFDKNVTQIVIDYLSHDGQLKSLVNTQDKLNVTLLGAASLRQEVGTKLPIQLIQDLVKYGSPSDPAYPSLLKALQEAQSKQKRKPSTPQKRGILLTPSKKGKRCKLKPPRAPFQSPRKPTQSPLQRLVKGLPSIPFTP